MSSRLNRQRCVATRLFEGLREGTGLTRFELGAKTAIDTIHLREAPLRFVSTLLQQWSKRPAHQCCMGLKTCDWYDPLIVISSSTEKLYALQDIVALDDPGPAELQLLIKATTLCGSDLHYYKHFRNGDIQVREPLSLGHESAGVVHAVGSQVDNFKVGDRVALEVGLPCGECERCREGRYNICSAMRFRSSAKGFPHAQGTLQDIINHPAAWCHK